MSLFDKLFGRRKKSAVVEPRAERVPESLKPCVDELFQRFQPDRLHFKSGETLGDVFSRLVAEEEQRVRVSSEDPETKRMKLTALASLARDLGLSPGAPPTRAAGESGDERAEEPKEPTITQESEFRLPEATFEMVMGTKEELKDVPLGHFMTVVEL